jgi:hypothetical protein
MPDYSKQKVFCRVCAAPMETDFSHSPAQGTDGACCGVWCVRELWWRRTLAIMGKPYRPRDLPDPDPKAETKKLEPKPQAPK